MDDQVILPEEICKNPDGKTRFDKFTIAHHFQKLRISPFDRGIELFSKYCTGRSSFGTTSFRNAAGSFSTESSPSGQTELRMLRGLTCILLESKQRDVSDGRSTGW